MSPLDPYQSDAFREMRKRVHSLSSTPPAASPPRTHKQLSLPPSGTSTTSSASVPRPTQLEPLKSPTPSPPPSETSPSSCPPSASQTPLTQAPDSSASSFDDLPFRQPRRSKRRATDQARAWMKAHRRAARSRSTLAQKRVLSETDIFTHGLANDPKRTLYTGRSASASLPLTSPSSAPSVASSWRRALKRQRKRTSNHSDTAHAFRKARTASRTQTFHSSNQDRALSAPDSGPRLDVLPELRLLSATRTAPIGWTRMASISNPLAHTLEMYDERSAEQAPERQRFWPIVDHQLDYTGARMLSLSTARNGPLQLGTHCTKAPIPLPIDNPVSPKSGVCPWPMQPGMASSDEDRSPLTPGACVVPARARATASRHARDAVRNEPNRKPSVPLSPPATLAAMIDFTRAQHDVRERKSAAQVKALAEPQRNAYGQLPRLPCTPPVASTLAPHAPPRIAPRTAPTKRRDYFGHWESFLCGYGKESTF